MQPAIAKAERFLVLSAMALVLSACVSSDVLESATSTSASNAVSQAPELADETQSTVRTGDLASGQDGAENTSQIMAVAEPVPQSTTEQAISNEPATELAALAPADDTPLPQWELNTRNDPNAVPPQAIEIPAADAPRKTYLINGLLSAVPFIGYGFRNLKQKMPDAKLYSYMGVVEGPAVIAPQIIKDAEAAYRKDPSTRINLIGISLGADLITVIAERLNEKNVPVHYLGIVDGTNLRPITPNVQIADNLTCSYLDCTKARARLSPGNTTTQLSRKVYKSSHIPLGNHEELHAHVIARTQ